MGVDQEVARSAGLPDEGDTLRSAREPLKGQPAESIEVVRKTEEFAKPPLYLSHRCHAAYTDGRSRGEPISSGADLPKWRNQADDLLPDSDVAPIGALTRAVYRWCAKISAKVSQNGNLR